MFKAPDYAGGGLVNLVAELESRMTGSAKSPPLRPELAATIPPADRYVFVLIDGLGDLQMTTLKPWRRGRLDAPFSTQTAVATATIATGVPPSQHGQIAYLMKDDQRIVNTLYCYSLDGTPFGDPATWLPSPNVAERLATHSRKTVALLPPEMAEVPISPVVFRGVEVHYLEPADLVERALTDDSDFLFIYLPEVDTAAHAYGQSSPQYLEAMDQVASVWTQLAAALPAQTAMVGTADHGHVDVAPAGLHRLEPPEGVVCHGDDRVVYLLGPTALITEWASDLPGTLVSIDQARSWWGPGPDHPQLSERLPDMLLVADDGIAFHFPENDLVMIGYHGGLSEAEVAIPLLVAP